MDNIHDNSHRWIWPFWLDIIIIITIAVILASVVFSAIIFISGDYNKQWTQLSLATQLWTDGLIYALISMIVVLIIGFQIMTIYGSDRNSEENRHEPGDRTQVSSQQRKPATGDGAKV